MPGVDVARVLRNARDLMNTNGRHWIKGDMSLEVNKTLIERRNDGVDRLSLSPKAQVGDVVFCTWGGLREVADSFELQVEAMEALVQIIDERGWGIYCNTEDAAIERARYEYEDVSYFDHRGEFTKRYPTFAHYWAEKSLEYREETLGNVIAEWNDSDKRSWEDVRASLTKAAANSLIPTI